MDERQRDMAEQLNRKYVLERRLGRGGMGEVFAGRALGLQGFSRPVAIKRLHARYIEERALLVTEARLTARLLHQNIVTVFDLDADDAGRMFLVMELIEGSDLASLLLSGPMPVPCALYIACEMLRGLGYAHERHDSDDIVRGVVHRDVSPSNVLLGWDGSVKVADFGLAKVRLAAQASASVFVRGKPGYVSPEQANGDALDGRSDLFSVGIMLWEMLCGARLFGPGAKLMNLLRDPIPSPRSRVPELPEDIERITMRLLERDLDQRYARADAVIAELHACALFPKDGHEQIAALLKEREPARALHENENCAVAAVESLAEGEGVTAPTNEPPGGVRPPLGEPFADPPALGRAQKLALLAALVATTALATALLLPAALRDENTLAPREPASQAAPAVAPASSPQPQPPSQPPDDKRTVAPSEPSPTTSALAVPAPAASPPPPAPPAPPARSASSPKPGGGRGPSKKRPSPPAVRSDGMRVIDLRDLAQPTRDERREDSQ